jgi:hypothetical protein
MCAVIFGLGMAVDQFQWLWFFASIVVGMATYLGSIVFIEKTSGYKVFKDMRFILNSLRLEEKKAAL